MSVQAAEDFRIINPAISRIDLENGFYSPPAIGVSRIALPYCSGENFANYTELQMYEYLRKVHLYFLEKYPDTSAPFNIIGSLFLEALKENRVGYALSNENILAVWIISESNSRAWHTNGAVLNVLKRNDADVVSIVNSNVNLTNYKPLDEPTSQRQLKHYTQEEVYEHLRQRALFWIELCPSRPNYSEAAIRFSKIMLEALYNNNVLYIITDTNRMLTTTFSECIPEDFIEHFIRNMLKTIENWGAIPVNSNIDFTPFLD
jgi:hypothetical protein